MNKWQRLTPGDEDRLDIALYRKTGMSHSLGVGFQDNGELHCTSNFVSTQFLSDGELAALPPIKARDERIAKLEIIAETAGILIARLAEVNGKAPASFALQAALDYGSEVARVTEALEGYALDAAK